MKNAFGGLLNEHRHWTHPVIHETLVDLLMIQKRIHRGVFAVMDGTFAGDGPGPRCMVPCVKNVILASADQVAIDAVAAKLKAAGVPTAIYYPKPLHQQTAYKDCRSSGRGRLAARCPARNRHHMRCVCRHRMLEHVLMVVRFSRAQPHRRIRFAKLVFKVVKIHRCASLGLYFDGVAISSFLSEH